MTANELWNTWDCRIPLTGKWEGLVTDKIFGLDAGDVMEFMGWFISEGWSVKCKNTGTKTTLGIGQSRESNPVKSKRIEELFNRLGFSWNYVPSSMAYYVGIRSMPTELVKMCHSLGTAKDKFIPTELFKYSTALLGRLHESMILGDGCTTNNTNNNRKDRRNYFTVSKRLADDFQTLTLLIGLRGKITIRKSNNKQKNDLYCVGVNIKPYAAVDDAKRLAQSAPGRHRDSYRQCRVFSRTQCSVT